MFSWGDIPHMKEIDAYIQANKGLNGKSNVLCAVCILNYSLLSINL